MITIEHATFHFSSPAAAVPFIAGEMAKATQLAALEPKLKAPAIGQPWHDGQGLYAGVSRGINGQPDTHTVAILSPAGLKRTWAGAKEWAEQQGGGARRPTKNEGALLVANLREHFDAAGYYWLDEQFSAHGAYIQDFADGNQNGIDEDYEFLVCAVRSYPIE